MAESMISEEIFWEYVCIYSTDIYSGFVMLQNYLTCSDYKKRLIDNNYKRFILDREPYLNTDK